MTEKTQKTHKIIYFWSKTPYILHDQLKTGERIRLRLFNITQTATFQALTQTMFAAHGLKLKKEDRAKQEFEIFISGSLKECEDMQEKMHKLHKLDFDKVRRTIKPIFRKRVLNEAKKTQFDKIQDSLANIGIDFGVKIEEV